MKGKNCRLIKGRPYTRKKFIRGAPTPKISKFIMGDPKGKYAYKVSILSQNSIQIRHNALEAARIAANKVMGNKFGDKGYLMQMRVYPHIVLRENKMIATAGADRLQEGMRKAFGKPIGRAARIKESQVIIDIYVSEEEDLKIAKEALGTSAKKIPSPCRITIEKLSDIE